MVTNKKPCFFKIMLDGLTTHHLRIPPCFMKNITRDFSDRATLKGPSGGIWHVKLAKRANGVFIVDGWQGFIRDHSLGDVEFLLFTYDGDMCFTVQIFDKSGLERVDDVPIDPITHPEPVVKRKRGRPRKSPLGSQPLPRSFGSGVELDQSCMHDKSTEEMNGTTRRKAKTDGNHPPTERTNSCNFTSKFPYFESCMKDYNVSKTFVLNVPNNFAKKFLPSVKTKMVLMNPKGENWMVNYIPRGACIFSGGWSKFVFGNKINEGDTCIFELVDKKEMQVHVFRLSE